MLFPSSGKTRKQIFKLTAVLLTFTYTASNAQFKDDLVKHPPLSSFKSSVNYLESLPDSERRCFVTELTAKYPQTPVIENDSVVNLYWYGKANRLMVHGDLQDGWAKPDTLEKIICGDSNFFFISYNLPADARLDYVFQPDDVHMTDPRNPTVTPSGYGPHSEIAMPGFQPDSARWERPGVPGGTMSGFMLKSSRKSISSREVLVYLPADYNDLKDLPVLYVLDGIEAMHFMNYKNVLDNLIFQQKIRPLIVVFIPPFDRGGEFMGPLRDKFIDVLCKEFVTEIDRNFKTSAIPENRGVTGISAGGFLALYIPLRRPDYFRNGAGQSPSVTHSLYQALDSFSTKIKPDQNYRIYFDVGRYDLPEGSGRPKSFLQDAQEFSKAMSDKKINHKFQVVNDGHEWANWRERTDEILVYFFGRLD